MGTVRSIIDIDVKSEAFTEFQKKFDAYQKALAAMPADWSKASAGASKFAQIHSQGMLAAGTALSNVVRQQGEVSRGAGNVDRMFKGVARTTGEILRNVTDVTFQLIKWGAFGGILGIAAGGFGAGALAGAGADIRRDAGRLNATPGQLRAARAVYGRQIDADSVLENIAATQSDLTKRFALGAMGLNADQSAGDLLPGVLQGAVDRFRQFGNVQGYNATGANNLVDFSTARELSKLSPKELQDEAHQYGAESGRLGISAETLKTMTALNRAFDIAKDRIETVLIDGLGRVAPNLEHLSDSIVKAFETFMNNPKMGDYIDSFGKSIEDVAAYLASDSFKQDINDFVNLIHKAAHPFDTVSNVRIPWSGSDTGGTSLKDAGEYWGEKAGNLRDWLTGGKASSGMALAYKQRQLAITEQTYGLPAGMLDKIWSTESSRGARGGVNPTTGAFGDFQFLPSTAKDYGLSSDSNWLQQEDAAGRKLRDLLKEYKGDARKALAAYFGGDGNVNKAIAQPGNWEDNLHPKTAAYLAKTAPGSSLPHTDVTIRLDSPAGSDINPIMTQLVHY